ncbi:MAG: nitrite reductase [Deltaproteobacteria bacterium]|nr:nitrite reductase [Deltaproteobacteria bacterium]
MLLAGEVTEKELSGAKEQYRELCRECHGALRYGGYAPPLIPETLGRSNDEKLAQVILDGLPQTQMKSYRDKVSPAQAKALAALLRQPVGEISWESSDITASLIRPEKKPGKYTPPRDLEKTVLVVERGTGSLVVLDGDGLKQLDKAEVGRIHGGPKFTGDYKSVVVSTRDGTIARYELLEGGLSVMAKVAVNTRNVAVSPAGDWVAVANQLPRNLVLMDGQLRPKKVLPLKGTPSGVYHHPGTDKFVLTLRDAPQMIFVEYPSLKISEIELPIAFEDFTFVPGSNRVIASSRGGTEILLYDLNRHAVLGSIQTSGLPHLFSATFFMRDGKLKTSLNHIGVSKISVIDMESFSEEKTLALKGAGYFVRTHPGTPYLWADSNTEAIQLIDKRTLELLDKSLVPQPGKKAMHTEFTADGKLALVSIWDKDGAVVVYDSTTLKEVSRQPYNMPVGKYNALNKTDFPVR